LDTHHNNNGRIIYNLFVPESVTDLKVSSKTYNSPVFSLEVCKHNALEVLFSDKYDFK
jgi:hypothetical protein